MQRRLDYSDAVSDWLLECAEESIARGNLEEALKYTYVAATILSRQNRRLVCARLESSLQRIAERLEDAAPAPALDDMAIDDPAVPGETCFHVLSEALAAGGLTAMVIRWIENDPGRRHCVVLCAQRSTVPEELESAVLRSGGQVHCLDPADSFVRRASRLRRLVRAHATLVALHIDVADVIAGAAFGTPGGPPVLLANHAAHAFWTGASTVDLVLNVRGSALENHWTEIHRGKPAHAIVPVPLPPPRPREDLQADTLRRRRARNSLGIPEEALVLITVGASFKYQPVNRIDFLGWLENVLARLPNAYLLAVGFAADQRWNAASRRQGFRIRTLGVLPRNRLALVHDAADLYVEGFPFGTTTALLEAAIADIPVVLSPAGCPPPYGSDGLALDGILRRAENLDEYAAEIVRLATDPLARRALAEAVRNSVAAHHSGPGWRRHLDAAMDRRPAEHRIARPVEGTPTPRPIHEYWGAFVERWNSRYDERLEQGVDTALSLGLRPRLAQPALHSIGRFADVRANRTIPLPLLALFLDRCAPLLPTRGAAWTFRSLAFLFRGALVSRTLRKARAVLRGNRSPGSWYSEYRK